MLVVVRSQFILRSLGLGTLMCLLTGCVNYQLGLDLHWDGSGTLNQQVQIEPLLAVLARPQIQQVMRQLSIQTEQVGAQLTTTEDLSELQVRLAFRQLRDLEMKFKILFATTAASPKQEPITTTKLERPAAQSTPTILSMGTLVKSVQLDTRDFFVMTYYHAVGEFDLRPWRHIPLRVYGQTLSLPSDKLVQLHLRLGLPWPALATNAREVQGNTLVWQISTERINKLEASFLLPNLVGLSWVSGIFSLLSLGLGLRWLARRAS